MCGGAEVRFSDVELSCPLCERDMRCMCGLLTEESGGRQLFPEDLSSSAGESKGN